MGGMSELTLDEINELVGDDIEAWLTNPFMSPGMLIGKVCWWISTAVNATKADQ